MSDENDEQLDQLLSDHFRRRLDPQLGRASATFEEAATSRTPTPPRHLRMPIIAAVGGLIAAAVLIAFPLLQNRPGDGDPRRFVVVGGHPRFDIESAPPATTTAAASQDDVNFNRLVMWQAVDEGARVVDDTLPVRKVRYEALEQIEWEDPDDQATIQLSVPVAEVVLVQQPTF